MMLISHRHFSYHRMININLKECMLHNVQSCIHIDPIQPTVSPEGH